VAAFLRDADDVGRGAWLVHQLHGDVLGPFPASIWRSGARPVLQPVIGLGRRPRGGLVVPPLVIAVRMLEALRARHVAARLLAVMRQLVSERATLEQSRRRPPDAGEPRPHPVQPGRARGG
jgi:hypothetical protein